MISYDQTESENCSHFLLYRCNDDNNNNLQKEFCSSAALLDAATFSLVHPRLCKRIADEIYFLLLANLIVRTKPQFAVKLKVPRINATRLKDFLLRYRRNNNNNNKKKKTVYTNKLKNDIYVKIARVYSTKIIVARQIA